MHETEVKGILSARNGINIYRGCSHGFIFEENARQFISNPMNWIFACIQEKQIIGFQILTGIKNVCKLTGICRFFLFLSSGKHSDRYVQCAKLLQYPDKAAKALSIVVENLKNVEIDIVVA